jgi:hypothetical protein
MANNACCWFTQWQSWPLTQHKSAEDVSTVIHIIIIWLYTISFNFSKGLQSTIIFYCTFHKDSRQKCGSDHCCAGSGSDTLGQNRIRIWPPGHIDSWSGNSPWKTETSKKSDVKKVIFLCNFIIKSTLSINLLKVFVCLTTFHGNFQLTTFKTTIGHKIKMLYGMQIYFYILCSNVINSLTYLYDIIIKYCHLNLCPHCTVLYGTHSKKD